MARLHSVTFALLIRLPNLFLPAKLSSYPETELYGLEIRIKNPPAHTTPKRLTALTCTLSLRLPTCTFILRRRPAGCWTFQMGSLPFGTWLGFRGCWRPAKRLSLG